MNRLKVEVCAGSLEDCQVAQAAGATRIELNQALPLGGLTPSVALLESVKRTVELPVICMARPRPGNFCYSATEFDQLSREIECLLEAGADGIAVGISLADGSLDAARCDTLLERFGRTTCEWVYHRAIDLSPRWEQCLSVLAELGFVRVLTSGQAASAPEGAETIRKMVKEFGESIEILAGAGIHSANVVELIQATGVTQVHGSFSRLDHRFETHCGDFGTCRVTDRGALDEVILALASIS